MELIKIEEEPKRNFYMKETINSRWSVRELQRQRKHQWAFEDAKEDAVTRKNINTDYQRGGEAPMHSTCISTDRSTLKPRRMIK